MGDPSVPYLFSRELSLIGPIDHGNQDVVDPAPR